MLQMNDLDDLLNNNNGEVNEEERIIRFNNGPYNEVRLQFPEVMDYHFTVDKEFILDDNGVIFNKGITNEQSVTENVDVKDIKIKITNNNGVIRKKYDKIQKNRGIRDLEEDIFIPQNGIIVAGQNELFDNIFIEFDETQFVGLGNGSNIISGNDMINIIEESEENEGNSNGNESEDIEEFKTVFQSFRNLGMRDDETYQLIGGFSVQPSNGRTAVKRVNVLLTANPEKEYILDVNDEGVYDIEIPEGKDFIMGGRVNVVLNDFIKNDMIEDWKTEFISFRNMGFHDTNDAYDYLGNINISKSQSKEAMRSAIVNVTCKPERNYEINCYDNGIYNIEIPEGKDFILGGSVNVNSYVDKLRFMAQPNFYNIALYRCTDSEVRIFPTQVKVIVLNTKIDDIDYWKMYLFENTGYNEGNINLNDSSTFGSYDSVDVDDSGYMNTEINMLRLYRGSNDLVIYENIKNVYYNNIKYISTGWISRKRIDLIYQAVAPPYVTEG